MSKHITNFDLLKDIMKMNRVNLYDFLLGEMEKHYGEVFIDTNMGMKNYLYVEGEEPIMVVAHLDTVFEDDYLNFQKSFMMGASKYAVEYPTEDDYYYPDYAVGYDRKPKPKKVIYHDKEKGVLWSPQGLGADDRTGVFMILSLIRDGFRPSVLFTTDEETTSYSAMNFADDYKNADLDLRYIVELDREGDDDCVFYNCDNKEFVSFVESFGFKENYGIRTDISEICPVLKIAGVNLSIGYKGQHTTSEMQNLNTMEKTYNKVCNMIKDLSETTPTFEYIPRKVYTTNKSVADMFTKAKDNKEIECSFCKKKTKDYLYEKTFGKICQECFETLLF